MLLTEDDFLDSKRHANLRATLSELLELGVIPINENDTVSTVELEASRGGRRRVFGENDKLSALVMTHVGADLLVLLSDVDGLYTDDPQAARRGTAGAATLVSESTGVTEIMRGFARGELSPRPRRHGDELDRHHRQRGGASRDHRQRARARRAGENLRRRNHRNALHPWEGPLVTGVRKLNIVALAEAAKDAARAIASTSEERNHALEWKSPRNWKFPRAILTAPPT